MHSNCRRSEVQTLQQGSATFAGHAQRVRFLMALLILAAVVLPVWNVHR
jgi:hypothetical protein